MLQLQQQNCDKTKFDLQVRNGTLDNASKKCHQQKNIEMTKNNRESKTTLCFLCMILC